MPDAKISFSTNIPESIRNDPEKARAVGAIFLFRITGEEGGVWTVNLKDELGVTEGDGGSSECTIEVSNEVWRQMTENPASAMQFYFDGKLRVSGNAMLAMKLQAVIS
jgi:3-hydroxyacyl-CoA dehydrogenase/3a,7a,12a-trihydroxy-5b-cholest-24-enoyl-CoA hydratase